MTMRLLEFHRRCFRPVIAGVLLPVAAFATGCNSGPSLKQRADEGADQRAALKKQAAFEKSLPPTQSKPVFKP